MPIKFQSSTGKLFWYGTTVFFSSALLLVLEIVAGRLLAPYVGVSMYTWTSIIGVILAGLAVGNWIGGRLADQGATELTVGVTLIVGALTCFGILALLMLIAPPLQASEIGLLGASFLFVVSLFFLPAVFLGIVTPLLTTIALKLDTRAGHVVGRMHALAALGSILGTFVTGYWLIQTMGTKNIIISASAALMILAIPFLRTLNSKVLAIIGAASLFTTLFVVTQKVQGFVSPCDRESNYYCIRVIDENNSMGNTTARSLILDHMNHSTNVKDFPDSLWVPYVHAMDEIIHFHSPNIASLKYFFAGGGAYTHPRALRYRYQDAEITVSELDPAVTATARSALFFDSENIHIIHNDARVALQKMHGEKFDVIITDVFHDLAIPYHLTTLEYLQLVKSRLTPNGLYLANIVDVFPDPRLVKSILKTLQTQFRYVNVWLERPPEFPTRLTYVVSANNWRPIPNTLEADHGEPRTWYGVIDILYASGTPLSDVPILTDDYAPVDHLVSALLLGKEGR